MNPEATVDIVADDFSRKLQRSRAATQTVRDKLLAYNCIITGKAVKPDESGKLVPSEKIEDLSPINPLHRLEDSWLPTLLANDPQHEAQALDDADESERAQARVAELIPSRIWVLDNARNEHVKHALREAARGGNGFVLVDHDKVSRRPFVEFIPFDCMDVDVESGRPGYEYVRWLSIRLKLPLQTALQMFPNKGINESTATETVATGNLPSRMSLTPSDLAGHQQPRGADSEFVTVYRVFVKGEDPHSGEQAKGPRKKRGGERPEGSLYKDGANKTLYIANINGAWKTLREEAWPYTCARGKFPVAVLRLTGESTTPVPSPKYDAYRGSVWAASSMARAEIENASVCSRLLMLLPSNLDPTNRIAGWLRSGETATVISTTLDANALAMLKQALTITLGQPSVVAASAATRATDWFEFAARTTQLIGESKSHETAAAALGDQQRAETRIDEDRQAVEEFCREISTRIFQCARSRMEAEDVAYLIGDEPMMWQEEPELDLETGEYKIDELTKQPKSKQVALAWPDSVSDEWIADACGLTIKETSTLRIDKMAKAQGLELTKQSFQASTAFVAQLTGVVPQPLAIAKMLYSFDVAVARLRGFGEAAKLVPQPEEMFQVAPPMGQGGGGMDGGETTGAAAGDTQAMGAAAQGGRMAKLTGGGEGKQAA